MKGRDIVEKTVTVLALVAVCAPVLPPPRVAYWCAMTACQRISRHFGLLALAAENRYRQEIL